MMTNGKIKLYIYSKRIYGENKESIVKENYFILFYLCLLIF